MTWRILSALCVGLLFGSGLLLSGLANPAKVLAFLDVAGAWDPSLALVMGGAIAVGLVAFTLGSRRRTSLLGEPMRLPQAQDIDAPLVLGSLGFGIGWGLVGFCPGPALVAMGTGAPKAVLFVLSMLAGMALFELMQARSGQVISTD
jgi:uncharacterized membrane protein YedE/YeeE